MKPAAAQHSIMMAAITSHQLPSQVLVDPAQPPDTTPATCPAAQSVCTTDAKGVNVASAAYTASGMTPMQQARCQHCRQYPFLPSLHTVYRITIPALMHVKSDQQHQQLNPHNKCSSRLIGNTTNSRTASELPVLSEGTGSKQRMPRR